jgi:hypothetical protein
MKKGSKKPAPGRSVKKPVREIMIPRRRDFMGDLGDWVAESPGNKKEFEAMVAEIFEEVAQNRKAREEVSPPSPKTAMAVDPAKSPAKKRSKKK